MPSSMNWVDGAAGGTPVSAANLNRLAVTADVGTAGTPTGDALKAAQVARGKSALGFFSVIDYGADPTGVASSSAAFDAAHAAARAAGLGATVVYPSGTYSVIRSIRPLGTMNHLFGGTVQITATGTATDYTEVLSTGQTTLVGLTQGDSNIPVPTSPVRALWDVAGCTRSAFLGNLTLAGAGGSFGLAGMANSVNTAGSTNSIGCSFSGELRLQALAYGLFGTPRWSSVGSFPATTFNQWAISRLYIANNVLTPIVAGDNTFDDSWISNYHSAGGGTSYAYLTQLNLGSHYVNGNAVAGYGFHVRRALLKFATLYAEGNTFTAPVYADKWSHIEGTIRLGAGSNTAFVNKCFIQTGTDPCYVNVSVHPRSGDASLSLTDALVKMTSGGSQRRVTIRQPYANDGTHVTPTGYTGTPDITDQVEVFCPGDATGASGGTLFVRKAADTSRSSADTGATLTDDPELVLTVAANTTYIIDGYLRYEGSTTGDFGVKLVGPSGCTIDVTYTAPTLAASGNTSTLMAAVADGSNQRNLGAVGAASLVGAPFKGLLRTASTAGTLKVQWCQVAADATATILHTDSYLRLVKVS